MKQLIFGGGGEGILFFGWPGTRSPPNIPHVLNQKKAGNQAGVIRCHQIFLVVLRDFP